MKKILALFIAVFITFSGTAAVMAQQLVDVTADHWAAKEILTVINGGIMGITADGHFNPNEVMTRAEFNTTLLRLLGHRANPSDVDNVFTDVSEDFWAYSDIMKSRNLGLIYGYGDNTFRPLNNISKIY